ncbi:N-acetyltransferase [Candidatus Atribacteria bacterium HGW-Atribacteria-1]|nr:MAG: N-acetyltransferase [Candidatus Atribacteria bacterium HGW-Atribacteria-1]
MKTKYFVHETALVEKGAKIGEGTKIWHFCHISKGAIIGKNCNIGQNCYVADGGIIGNGCKLQNNISVYTDVIIEDDVFCGPSMVFTNVVNPRAFIERKHEYKKTIIKKGASIGANATIVCGSVIGKYAFIGAGSVVTKAIPDYALVYGLPARIRGWVCECGVKIQEKVKKLVCPECGKSYIRAGEAVEEIKR